MPKVISPSVINSKEKAEKGLNEVAFPVLGLDLTEHGKKVDAEAIEKSTYVLYSESQLKERELIVKDPYVYQGQQLLDTKFKKAIWVLHPDRRIFVDFSILGKVFHSSLMAGKKPIAAGEMIAFKGVIILLNEESGHYHPLNRIKYLIQELESRPLNVKNITVKVATPPQTTPVGGRRQMKVNVSPPQTQTLQMIVPVPPVQQPAPVDQTFQKETVAIGPLPPAPPAQLIPQTQSPLPTETNQVTTSCK